MNDYYTIEELIDKIDDEIDPDLLVELLNLTSREIAEAHPDKVWIYREKFLDE